MLDNRYCPLFFVIVMKYAILLLSYGYLSGNKDILSGGTKRSTVSDGVVYLHWLVMF